MLTVEVELKAKLDEMVVKIKDDVKIALDNHLDNIKNLISTSNSSGGNNNVVDHDDGGGYNEFPILEIQQLKNFDQIMTNNKEVFKKMVRNHLRFLFNFFSIPSFFSGQVLGSAFT